MEDVSGLTDWTRCAICQNDKNEPLRCPAESIAKSNIGAGYKTLAQNTAELSDLGCLPNDFDGVANFSLYVDSVAKILLWFFALNHYNYACWLSVHLLDMHALPQTAPDVAGKFNEGFFTVNKSSKHFSAIAIDQAHEQNNAIVKGDGGAVGLTENESALRRWMVSGPAIARVVNEFEDDINVASSNDVKTKHHEEQRSFQVKSFKDVKALVASIEDLGNPFMEESEELLVLDTKEIANLEALKTLREIETIGKQQSDTFLKECLVERKKSLYDPIKKNKLHLFSTPAPKSPRHQNRFPPLRVIVHCLQDCTYHVNPETAISTSSLNMKTKVVHRLCLILGNCVFPGKSQSW